MAEREENMFMKGEKIEEFQGPESKARLEKSVREDRRERRVK